MPSRAVGCFPACTIAQRFDVRETEKECHIAMDSLDGSVHVSVEGSTADELAADSLFANVAECSHFFQKGSVGYSPAKAYGKYDGMELCVRLWRVQPLDVTHVRSSFFDDRGVFPDGSVTFDNALLMRGVDHEWHSRASLCV